MNVDHASVPIPILLLQLVLAFNAPAHNATFAHQYVARRAKSQTATLLLKDPLPCSMAYLHIAILKVHVVLLFRAKCPIAVLKLQVVLADIVLIHIAIF